jgi:KUP system potassium uptake protein
MTKLVHGAWLPLLIAITTITVMITWLRGSTIVTRKRDIAEGPLDAFVDQLSGRRGLLRLPGTAVFLNRGTRTAPLALRANVEHNQVLHEQVVIVTIVTLPIPRAHDSERVEVDPLGRTDDGIIHVTARFGYMETPDVPRTLRVLEPTKTEGSISIDDASYFLSKIDLVKGDEPSMPAWQTNLFVATAHLSADAAEFFCLPQDRTLIMGSRIEV